MADQFIKAVDEHIHVHIYDTFSYLTPMLISHLLFFNYFLSYSILFQYLSSPLLFLFSQVQKQIMIMVSAFYPIIVVKVFMVCILAFILLVVSGVKKLILCYNISSVYYVVDNS